MLCYDYMNGEVFLLLTDSNQSSSDIIYSRDTDLKVKVYYLDEMNFKPNANEIQLYGYYNKLLLAFETIDISADDALDMIPAIRWYAKYLAFPQLEILPDDPRIEDAIAATR